MRSEPEFRQPTDSERALLQRLLEGDFQGRDELSAMMRDLQVRLIDDEGSLELYSKTSGRAPVLKRIPVEAEAKDDDGIVIHALLHVIDGRPTELEVFKEDGSSIRRMPLPSAFEIIVLQPAPHNGSE
jgi:hypothetical protein